MIQAHDRCGVCLSAQFLDCKELRCSRLKDLKENTSEVQSILRLPRWSRCRWILLIGPVSNRASLTWRCSRTAGSCLSPATERVELVPLKMVNNGTTESSATRAMAVTETTNQHMNANSLHIALSTWPTRFLSSHREAADRMASCFKPFIEGHA